ncbi:MAG: uroporphyrinogen-III C-methyltransferase [Hyphomicrobiales bacterium]
MKEGKVVLVGAGPGDPDLLTVKAVRAIAAADVIVYDRLVSSGILDLAPAGVARINVGKQPNLHPVSQSQINALLVKLARCGRDVVRLKGGDPFVFGRGSEEALELSRAGIEFDVVPGITSAQGLAASLRVPLTHRGMANGVRLVTGHCRDDMDLDLDWQGLCDPRTTLVVYMGLANLPQIAGKLMAHGRSGATPALAVSSATLPGERRLATTLGKLVEDVTEAGLQAPVLFVVGEVASLFSSLVRDADSEGESCASGLAAGSR